MREDRGWSRLPVLLLVLVATACGGGEEAAEEAPRSEPAAPPPGQSAAPTGTLPPGVTAEMVQQGQRIFAGPGLCYTCHGQNAQGTTLAPNLTDDEWIWITPGDDMHEQVVTLIQTGVVEPREHTGIMPPRGGGNLSEEQIRAVAGYVLSLSQG